MIDINGVEFAVKDQNRHHPRGVTCWHYSRFRLTCDEYDALRAAPTAAARYAAPQKQRRATDASSSTTSVGARPSTFEDSSATAATR
ncbi:hypothetical protein GCM10027072_08340 [Streptomyces bullii]